MNDLFMISIGFFVALVADWLLNIYRQSEQSAAKQNAEKILAKHGMSSHLYLATIGIEDNELRRALDCFAFSGRIVLDARGNVVGKVIPKVQVTKRQHLRLAVDNTRKED